MNTKNLMNQSRTPLVYWLNTEDVQKIAIEKLQRNLTSEEIEKLIEPISEQINWAEAIGYAIDQNL